jgi:hypothetical protein
MVFHCVHLIPFWLVWSGQKIECTVHIALTKQPIKQFRPIQQCRQQAVIVYCLDIYTFKVRLWCKKTMSVPWWIFPRLEDSIFLFISLLSTQSTKEDQVRIFRLRAAAGSNMYLLYLPKDLLRKGWNTSLNLDFMKLKLTSISEFAKFRPRALQM